VRTVCSSKMILQPPACSDVASAHNTEAVVSVWDVMLVLGNSVVDIMLVIGNSMVDTMAVIGNSAVDIMLVIANSVVDTVPVTGIVR